MKSFLTFVWKRTWCRLLLVVLFLLGLTLVHPFIRQSIFGPTIDGLPWYLWEDEIRRSVHGEGERSWFSKLLAKVGAVRDQQALGLNLHSPSLLPVYLHLAETSDTKVRQHAIDELANQFFRHKHAEILSVLRRRLQDEDAHCRVLAAWGAWRITKDSELAAVGLALIDHPEPPVRQVVVTFLCGMARDEPALFEPLARKAASSDVAVNYQALRAMGHFGKRGVPVIRNALANPGTRMSGLMAAWDLGDAGREIIPDLVALQNDDEMQFRRHVAHTLYKLAPKEFPKPANWVD